MSRRPHYLLYVASVALGVTFLMPSEGRASRFGDCLFGRSPVAATTYAPPYVPAAPVYAAPPSVSCQPCQAIVAPACGSCVPQTCQYAPQYAPMPGVVYRALYAPAVATAYQPVAYSVAYRPAAYTSYMPVTTYRPFFGTYHTRLVPYTTYRPMEAAVVTAYSPVAGCAAPCSSCSPCAGGACGGVSYEAPALGCSSCASPAPSEPTPTYSSEQPAAQPSNPASNPPSPYNPRGRTFEEKTNKPADTDLKPIPQPENTRPSSLPTPSLPDPNSKTAARPVSSAARVQLAARPIEEEPLKDDGGWHAVKE